MSVSFHQHPDHDRSGCSVCAERGFVSKTATPRFAHKEPPPPPPPNVCHGCVERAAIMAEVAGLREMVLSLSNGMLELNSTVAEQKRKISILEARSSFVSSEAVSAAAALQQKQQEQKQQEQQISSTALTGISAVVERMINNNIGAIEARIAATVRAVENERSNTELRTMREELNRKASNLQQEFDRKFAQLETRWGVGEKQLRESISLCDRRHSRSIFQMCQNLGIAVPPAAAEHNNGNNTSTASSLP